MKAQTAISLFDQIERLDQIKKSLSDLAQIRNINFQINKLNKTIWL